MNNWYNNIRPNLISPIWGGISVRTQQCTIFLKVFRLWNCPLHVYQLQCFFKHLKQVGFFNEHRINRTVEYPTQLIHLHDFTINRQKKVQYSTLEEKLLSLTKHSQWVYVERSKWYAFKHWQNVCIINIFF